MAVVVFGESNDAVAGGVIYSTKYDPTSNHRLRHLRQRAIAHRDNVAFCGKVSWPDNRRSQCLFQTADRHWPA